MEDTSKLRCFQRESLAQLKEQDISCLIASRQIGKTVLARELLKSFLTDYDKRKNPVALVTATTNQQAYSLHCVQFLDMLGDYPLKTVSGSAKDGTTVVIKRPWKNDYVTIHFRGTTNPKAILGYTIDLWIGDEIAQYNVEVYTNFISPTLDEFDGKKLLISTIEDASNFFTQLHELYNGITFTLSDAVKAGYRTQKFYDKKVAELTKLNQYHIFLKMYECDPHAAPMNEAPFSPFIVKANTENMAFVKPTYSLVSIVDIGKPSNNPAWTLTSNKNFINYEDSKDNQKLIIHLVTKFPNAHHTIFYPHDVNVESVVDGITRFEKLKEFVRINGLQRKVTLETIPQTKKGGRVVLVQEIPSIIKNSKVSLENCRKGLDKLSGCRLKKDNKTNYVHPSDWVANDSRHAGDALLYLAAVCLNKLFNWAKADEEAIVKLRGHKGYDFNNLQQIHAKLTRRY